MDPCTAVGLVSNIIQLIDFARDIAISVQDIRRSKNGLPQSIDQFRVRAELVGRNLDDLIASPSAPEKDDAFRDYAKNIRPLITDYLSKVDGLKLQESKGKTRIWLTAFKCVWRREEFEASYKAIENIGTQLAMHIITVHVPATSSKISWIQEHNLQMEANLCGKMEELLKRINGVGGSVGSNGSRVLCAVQKWFEDREQIETQRKCVQALYFDQVCSRENEVKDAHMETFKWILDDTTADPNLPQQSNFKQWLRSQDRNSNVFWISGKPGAGKSTLMKFLVRHPRMQDYLREWAGNEQVIIAECFFWRHGTRIQRSILGLMRSLLYRILTQCPGLISVAFPNPEWLYGGKDFQFSRRALEDAFSRLTASLRDLELRLFIMIDGLDEFDDKEENLLSPDDQQDLINLLRTFYRQDTVKLCVSSRPLPIFEQEFGQDKSRCISMQQLTAEDIRRYINGELKANKIFKELVKTDQDPEDLVNEILEAAQGVFLWVHLAVRSLLEGIRNEDRLSTLRARLRELPQEMNQLYRHILKSIEPKYERSSALLFLTHLEFHLQFTRGPSFFTLIYNYIEDDEYEMLMQVEKLDRPQLVVVSKRLGKRINALCKGLLEYETIPEAKSGFTDIWHNGRIQFCHRSVVEFLKEHETKRSLLQKASVDSQQLDLLHFRSCVALARVTLMLVKSGDQMETARLSPAMICCIEFCAWHSYRSKMDIGNPFQIELEWLLAQAAFENGHSIIYSLIARILPDWDVSVLPAIPESNLLAVLVSRGIDIGYVESRIWDDSTLLEVDKNGMSLLYLACMTWMYAKYPEKNVLLLLKCGSNPNRVAKGLSPWQRFLVNTLENMITRNMDWVPEIMQSLIASFIHHGADMEAMCHLLAFIVRGEFVLCAPGCRGHKQPSLLYTPVSLSAGEIVGYIYAYLGLELSEDIGETSGRYRDPKELKTYLESIKSNLMKQTDEQNGGSNRINDSKAKITHC